MSTENPRLAIQAREGLVMVVMVCRQRKYPLRLAFRAREGVEIHDEERRLSLRHVGSVEVSKVN